MSPRRLLAAAGLALAVLSVAPAAGAASPRAGWTKPAPKADVDGVPLATLDEPGPLQGVADFDAGVQSVAFRLTQDADVPAGDPCSAVGVVQPQVKSYDSTYVTFRFEAPFPCNRRYQVSATVTPAQKPLRQDTPTEVPLWIDVALPPQRVAGLRATLLGSRRAVSLRWDDASHEPDFTGFEVRRAVGSGPFQTIGSAGMAATSFVDEDIPSSESALTYRVVGVRSGPRAGSKVTGAGDEATVAVGATDVPTPGGGNGGAPSGPGGDVATGGGSTAGGVTPRSDVPSGGGVRTATGSFQVPGPTTPTTADTGYQEMLPFKPRQQALPRDGSSVVARIADDGNDTTRQTALLAAGGGVAFSWAMALRFLARRFSVI